MRTATGLLTESNTGDSVFAATRISCGVVLAAIVALACAGTRGPTDAKDSPTLTPQQSGTTKRLQAVSLVDTHVVWASGPGGIFVVTRDGGKT